MKYFLLLLILMLAAAPYMAKAEDMSSGNRDLPAIFKRVGYQQSYFCAVVKVTHADERVSDLIGSQISIDAIGSYTVLKETHIGHGGGDGFPRPLKKTGMSYEEAVGYLTSHEDCGAGQPELSESEWRAEMDARISDERGS